MTHSKFKAPTLAACTLAGFALIGAAQAQTTYTENFTGTTTQNSWYFMNGACLTAGTSIGTTSPGQIPQCVGLPYWTLKGDPNLVGGNTGTLPDDPAVGGALRFTNGFPGGYNENGAILSAFNFPTTNGIHVTFTTESYRGNSAGASVHDGADGMSFFLQSVDNGAAADIGDYGGSLGYTCSNANNDPTLRPSGAPRGYDGLIDGYIGLGIDEYGNFLNPGDNTASGPGYQGNRIGLRGAGGTAWSALNAAYPNQYPSTLTYPQQAKAVRQACANAFVYDWSAVGAWNTNGNLVPVTVSGVTSLVPGPEPDPIAPYQLPLGNGSTTTISLPDYTMIPGAFKILGAAIKIANESALYRGNGSVAQSGSAYGVPITYDLTISPAGLLSLAYSYNGGVYQPVITGQDITAANGPLPNNVRFGFAGSTGGGTNIHEIMCFQAQPSNQSSVSAGINQKQSAKVQIGSQVFFAYYNSTNWPGSLTSQSLEAAPGNPTSLIIDPVANWDASCVLTGVPAGQTCASTSIAGPTAAEGPGNRTILTWNGASGTAFEWTSLTAAQQAALDTGDPTNTPLRLNYLRGDRSNELTPLGVGLYRARTSVLGDIIDSSPTWVGPPSAGYPNVWNDLFASAAPTPPENAGAAQTYGAFTVAEQTRTNVVYAGANDGLLHGFRAGAYDASNNYQSANNDGMELLAYMPGYVLNDINSYANVANDYSNIQYAHHFDVDATPGTGDLYFGNQWHTWLVGGLGAGGNAIFALDITNPGLGGGGNFSEGAAAAQATVIGEWSTNTVAGVTTSTINCANVALCGANLGKTYGTPLIRRFHNGDWGFIIGNGFSSATGDAGIYVVTVDSTSGALTWYYLSTGQPPGAGDGIAFTDAADFDGDHIVDYVYAGDLLGNLWRFDLTDANPHNWAVTPNPLFTTPAGQPITTKPIIAINNSGPLPRVLVEFGTGRQIPMTNTAPASYSTTQQALYGIWDWNLSSWNSKSPSTFASLASIGSPTTTSNLVQQTITASYDATLSTTGSAYRTVSSNPVCYADTVGCQYFGWYLNLPIGPADPTNPSSPTVAEQVLFAPALISGVFVVNTTVPPTTMPTTCASTSAAAWTMALDPVSGGALTSAFFEYYTGKFINVTSPNGVQTGISGVADLGTGTPTTVVFNNTTYLVSSPVTSGGLGGGGNAGAPSNGTNSVCLPPYTNCPVGVHYKNITAQRLQWIQRR
ncbi:MAG: PilC/PilY family type IV pilus protein [Steroidobacteraceae bacterium]|jgi:type IV pilus assembly protein PilY1